MNDTASIQQETTSEVRQGALLWIVKAIVGLPFLAAILFLSAGRWDWGWGWVFIGLFVLAAVVQVLVLLPDPALLAERAKGLREKNAPTWDKLITGLAAGLLPLIAWIVAGLDIRFGWSPPMSPTLHLGGTVVFVLGWAVILWATVSNAFFSTTVRIQKERGHTVQTGGPYQFVRHPGYVGGLLYQLSTPFLLGSWWALGPMILTVPLFIIRTVLEDRLLVNELAGYRAYAARVRYRLLPGAW